MPYRKDGDRFEFVRLDTDTGVRTPLEALNQNCRNSLHSQSTNILPSMHFPPEATLSPDRKRLLLGPDLLSQMGEKPCLVFAVNLEGKEEVRIKMVPLFSFAIWLHDSHRFLADEATDGNGEPVMVHDLDRPKQATRLNVRVNPFDETLVGITQEEHLLLRHWNGRDAAGSVQIADIGTQAPSAPVRRFAINLPISAIVERAEISSDGKRLAWLLEYDYSAPHAQWLHRLWPSYKLTAESRLGLWVSRLDGAEMTEIGHKYYEDRPGELTDLQWLPGDKKISFIYNDALYTVDVP